MVVCGICENEVSEEGVKKVISAYGIIPVCSDCFREDMMVFEKPSEEKLKNIYTRKSVYTRLSEAAGVKDVDEHKKRISEFGKESSLMGNDLRRIVNRTYDERAKALKNENLVDNFQWMIMRARRAKKISQKQFAEEIQEPEALVAMAERGIIQPGNNVLVRKIEQYLKIKISKSAPISEEKLKEELLMKIERGEGIDALTAKTLTPEDLENAPRKKRNWWPFGKKKKAEEVVEEEKIEFSSDSPFYKE